MVRKAVEKVMENMYSARDGDVDLGAATSEGPVMKAINEYAPKALELLDTVKARLGRR